MDPEQAALLVAAGIAQGTEIGEMQFGDSIDVQSELAELVRVGKKRATSGLLRSFLDGGEQVPAAGFIFVVKDGMGRPRCLCRMIAVYVRRFADVDEIFARAEGEGDGSLHFWRTEHRAFFQREATRNGYAFSEDQDVVLQRFEVLTSAGR
jgi:uncharacterized protein YhfF